MFDEDINRKMALLDKNLIISSTRQIVLTESAPEGRTELTINLTNPAIAFRKLNEKRLKYFLCQSSSDHIVLQKADDDWSLHVIEMKRTVKGKEWLKIKEQFKGGILNGLCVSGFFGIKINKITCFTAYRNDNLNYETMPDVIELKRPLGETQRTEFEEWNSRMVKIALDVDGIFEHRKIKLTENDGIGNIDL